ncbi:hypothetical protein KAU45_09140 [bacterium]|nr:hypothetical protein [bacterium]
MMSEVDGELSWWVYPPTMYPWRALAGVVVLSLVVIFLSFYAGGPAVGVVGGAVIFFVLNGFFLPTSYKLNDEGLTWRRLIFRFKRPWSYFRCYYADRFGVMVTPGHRPNRLDPWRGVNLWFGPAEDDDPSGKLKTNRERVLAFIDRHVKPYCTQVDHRDMLG